MPSKPSPSRFALIYNVTKLAAIVVGLLLSVLCLMAVVGIFTDWSWTSGRFRSAIRSGSRTP